MKCPNCGEENGKDYAFCIYCGASLEGVAQKEEEDKRKAEEEDKRKAEKKDKREAGKEDKREAGKEGQADKPLTDIKKKGPVLLALIALAFIIFGFLLTGKRSQDGNSADTASGSEQQSASQTTTKETGSEVKETAQKDAQETAKEEVKETEKEDLQVVAKEEVQETIPDYVDIPSDAVTFRGHSYYIFDNHCLTWEEAEKYCESRGGYLAVINDKDEDDYLFNYMLSTGRSEVYFGLSDIEKENEWKWVGGRESNYWNWGINDDGDIEPNKQEKDERYAEYDASLTLAGGYWNDCGFGRDTKAYICEWDYSKQ